MPLYHELRRDRRPREVAAQPASAGVILVESRHFSGPQLKRHVRPKGFLPPLFFFFFFFLFLFNVEECPVDKAMC